MQLVRMCMLSSTIYCALLFMPRLSQSQSLVLGSGDSITIDTTTLMITGDATATGTLESGVATFNFDVINLASGVNVTLQGSNPLALNSVGNITIGTTLDASGADGGAQGPGSPGGVGKLGGYNGGAITLNGFGPGAGTFATGSDCCGGGGGGAFGGNGGTGRQTNAGGTAYGDAPLTTLQGGSGGAGGGDCCGGASTTGSGGGAGGGAISLFSEYGTINIASSGAVLAEGGSTTALRSGGGGAGGGILLDAGVGVIIEGLLSVMGGSADATDLSQNRGGGGGGGGRVAIYAPELIVDGVAQLAGPLSGVPGFLTADGGEITWAGTGDPGSGGGGGNRSAGAAGSLLFTAQEARTIPEPASIAIWTLIGLGLAGFGYCRNKRK